MSLPLFVVALSFAGGIGAPAQAPTSPTPSLAQEDRLEEDFGDPPPPPPLDPAEGEASLDAIGDAPPLPPPVVEDTPDAPAGGTEEEDVDRADAEDDDEEGGEGSVVLTRVLQYGAGFGTLALCGVLGGGASCCGFACLTSALQPLVFSLPLLVPCISALYATALGAAAGAAAGAVEVLVGNAFGSEEADLLWPTLATAGTGAGILALVGGTTLLSAIVAPAFSAAQPGNLQFSTPVTCLLSSASLVLCGAFCVATPLVGVLTYGSVATPKAPADEAAALSSAPQGPALASAAGAMAF